MALTPEPDNQLTPPPPTHPYAQQVLLDHSVLAAECGLHTLDSDLPVHVRAESVHGHFQEALTHLKIEHINASTCDTTLPLSRSHTDKHKHTSVQQTDAFAPTHTHAQQVLLDHSVLASECGLHTLDSDLPVHVRAESVYGHFQEALTHLKNKHIKIPAPGDVRGGGLLKVFCLVTCFANT